jgi:hypothetical protein
MVLLSSDKLKYMSGQDLARLIENVSESIQTEMRAGFADMRARLDRIEGRLGKHGGLSSGGGRQITRRAEWSEKIDELLAERDRTIEDLKRRVEKLESRHNGGKK